MTYHEWASRYPQAAADLEQLINAAYCPPAITPQPSKSEGYAQQQARMEIARSGGLAWRNNVGATRAEEEHKCPACSFKFKVKQTPIRYGLANDSTKLNKRFKSSDLIGIVPRLITPAMVGATIGQFASIETKRPGWAYSGNAREVAQAAWHHLILSKGGIAMFSTGGVNLD